MTNRKLYILVVLSILATACSTSRTIDLGDVETKRLITPDEIFNQDLKSPEVKNKKLMVKDKVKIKKDINEELKEKRQKIDVIKEAKVISEVKAEDFNNLKVKENEVKELTDIKESVDEKLVEVAKSVELVEDKVVVPAEYITLMSERLLNKVLNEADLLNKNIYVMEVKTLAIDLPETAKNSRYHIEEIIKNSDGYKLAGLLDRADYYIQPEIGVLDVEKDFNVYQYRLDLFNKKGDKVGSWSDVIRKSVGDNSWW